MASTIKWDLVDHTSPEPVHVGDMVSTAAGGMPIYQVVRCADGQLWLGGEHRQTVLVRPLESFRWKASA